MEKWEEVLECGVIPVAKNPRRSLFIAAYIPVVDGENMYHLYYSTYVVDGASVYQYCCCRHQVLIIFRQCKSTFLAADRDLFVVMVVFGCFRSICLLG